MQLVDEVKAEPKKSQFSFTRAAKQSSINYLRAQYNSQPSSPPETSPVIENCPHFVVEPAPSKSITEPATALRPNVRFADQINNMFEYSVISEEGSTAAVQTPNHQQSVTSGDMKVERSGPAHRQSRIWTQATD